MLFIQSCVPAAKVNHAIPCFSIRWKSKGSLFIKHLTLIFVFEFNCNTSLQINFVSLKVTVTSFQSISSVFHM